MKVTLTEVGGYEFEGTVLTSDLSDAQLVALGLTRDSETVKVEGEFHVDGALPRGDTFINIERIEAIGSDNGKTRKQWNTVKITDDSNPFFKDSYKTVTTDVPDQFTLDISLDVDLDSVSDQIAEFDDGSWAADALASAIDNAYDSLQD